MGLVPCFSAGVLPQLHQADLAQRVILAFTPNANTCGLFAA